MKFLSGVSLLAVAATCGALAVDPAYAVHINPIFATTYTGEDFGVGAVVSLSNDAEAEASIEAADNAIAKLFTNDVTVNILYYGAHDGTDGFLGANVTGQEIYHYADYAESLALMSAAHPANTVLASAVANLGSGNGATDPNAYVAPTTAGSRVLGLPGDPQFDATGDVVSAGGTVDAIVFLNLDQPLAFTRPLPDISSAVVYDAQSTMEHETDEVFGVGGAGSTLNDLLQDPNFAADVTGEADATLYGVDDLYRYADVGAPSYVANPDIDFSQSAYFSVDGGQTAVDYYNQEAMAYGDAADWGLVRNCPGGGVGGAGFVQDAFSCSNESPDVQFGTPEFVEFEALGMNVPEPSIWAILLTGFFGLGTMLRRRSQGGVHTAQIGPC